VTEDFERMKHKNSITDSYAGHGAMGGQHYLRDCSRTVRLTGKRILALKEEALTKAGCALPDTCWRAHLPVKP